MENFGREKSFAQNKLHIPDRIRIDLYCKLLYKQNSIKEQKDTENDHPTPAEILAQLKGSSDGGTIQSKDSSVG